MNKGRRQEIAKLKYKKRLKKAGAPPDAIHNPIGVTENGCRYNFTGFKNHSAPCSCEFCSPYKYDRAKERKQFIKDADNGVKEFVDQFYKDYGNMMSKFANE